MPSSGSGVSAMSPETAAVRHVVVTQHAAGDGPQQDADEGQPRPHHPVKAPFTQRGDKSRHCERGAVRQEVYSLSSLLRHGSH